MNEKKTTLGFTLFKFNTWSSWCWIRSSYLIYNFDTGWYRSNVDPVIEWQQLIVDHTGLYVYYPDQWSSGSYNDKQGWLKSCFPIIGGCYANHYPYNQIWTTYEGTWYYAMATG